MVPEIKPVDQIFYRYDQARETQTVPDLKPVDQPIEFPRELYDGEAFDQGVVQDMKPVGQILLGYSHARKTRVVSDLKPVD